MGSLIKNIFILGSILAIAAAGYYLIAVDRGSSIQTNDALNVNAAEIETQAFLRRLNELQEIKLSNELFSDPRFNALVDFSQPIQPVPFGRENPFLSR